MYLHQLHFAGTLLGAVTLAPKTFFGHAFQPFCEFLQMSAYELCPSPHPVIRIMLDDNIFQI